MKKVVLFLFSVLLVLAGTSYCDIEDQFTSLSDKNIEGYAQPFATTLGVRLNAGMYYTAAVSDEFSYGLSFRGMFISIPDDQMKFTPVVPEGYDKIETCTIYGNEGNYVYGPDGYITFPGGVDSDNVAFLFPQFMMAYKGTEFIFKFVPKIEVGENDFYLFGGAVKHEITRYFDDLPFDGAMQVGFSKFKLSDLMELNNFAINGQVSKTLGLFTLYGGLEYQKTTLNLQYDIKGDPYSGDPDLQENNKVDVDIDGDNGFGFTLGTSVKYKFFVLNADYTLNSQSIFSGGLSFEF